MKQVEQIQVCKSCKADVSDEATYCPFCGTDLLSPSSEPRLPRQDEKFTQLSLQESLASLYKPPYSMRNQQGFGIPDERGEPPFVESAPPRVEAPPQSHEKSESPQETAQIGEEVESSKEEGLRGSVWLVLLLSVGAHFFLLGLLLLFYSTKGRVILEWNSSYWLLYCLLSLPFLIFGVRRLNATR